MDALMQEAPLLLSGIIDYAAACHADTEIVSRSIEGPIHRYTYGAAATRVKQLARALVRLRIAKGDRIATLAWNTYRHFELHYAISGIGAICHTINPRLFRDQIAYIANHAEDRLLFVDLTFLPILEEIAPKLTSVERFVILADEAHMPRETRLPNLLCYEEFIGHEDADFEWPRLDERAACGLCYTSGTTGNPKGVLYSHRATVLHAMATRTPDVFDLCTRSVAMAVVPMFHANFSWGVPFGAPMGGTKLVLPGNKLDGASLTDLFNAERVTTANGVPTVYLAVLDHLQKSGAELPHLKRVTVAGSAPPRSMIEAFETRYGVEFCHVWGMTEVSPCGTSGLLHQKLRDVPYATQLDFKQKQGRGVFGVEMKVVNAENNALPRDGKSYGLLKVRGPWVLSSYFRGEGSGSFDSDGWFATGDVASLDPDGYMHLADRAKDLIKSGGEWISSIELENLAMAHPSVREAAAIGVPHPRWAERPLLVVVLEEGAAADKQDLLAFMAEGLAKWSIPDDVVFVDAIPHSATGKISKVELRDRFKSHLLPFSSVIAADASHTHDSAQMNVATGR
jgi:3-(methylthio)propionyl---CoA ligase